MAIRPRGSDQFWDGVVQGLHQEANAMRFRANPMAEGGSRWGGVKQGMKPVMPPSGTLSGRLKHGSEWRYADSRPPEQLPMFMSARDVESKYQVLEGDRQEVEDFDNPELVHRPAADVPAGRSAWGEYASSSGQSSLWSGSELPGTATAMEQMREKWGARGGNWGNPVSGIRTQNGGVVRAYGGERLETSDELYSRKLDEADEDVDWSEEHGPQSLTDRVLEQGVKKPISLGQQFGTEGKPQIVGGHHRMAIMREHAPDTLMPVLHYTDIHDAQRGHSSTYYKYS